MSYINIEIKARTDRHDDIRKFLLENGAVFIGLDSQMDTYFNTNNGRLKLRQGEIENNLIYYNRQNIPGAKQSDFDLVAIENGEKVKSILTQAMGVKIIVTKKREIYFIDNVKFHLDHLEGIGEFVEIEASNKSIDITPEKLREQCNFYLRKFGIREEDLVPYSYSDILMGIS